MNPKDFNISLKAMLRTNLVGITGKTRKNGERSQITARDFPVENSLFVFQAIYEEVNDARKQIMHAREITWVEVFDRVGRADPELMKNVCRVSHEMASDFYILCSREKLTSEEFDIFYMRLDEWKVLCFQMFDLIKGLEA